MLKDMPDPYKYDVFMSYRHGEADEAFVLDLVQKLEAANYKVAIDQRDFQPQQPFLTEMERCVKESRFTLAVITPRYLDSGNCEQEGILATVRDMRDRQRRLIPLILEKAHMPDWLYALVGINFQNPSPLISSFDKLTQTLGNPS